MHESLPYPPTINPTNPPSPSMAKTPPPQERARPFLERFKYAPNVMYLHSDERYGRVHWVSFINYELSHAI